MTTAQRHTVRALLVNPLREVLLMQMQFPWDDTPCWITPGGSLEPGESAPSALRRELYEELGFTLTDADQQPEVWYSEDFIERTHTHLCNRYFLIQTESFDPRPAALEDYEQEWLIGFRWWSVASIRGSNQRIYPQELGARLTRLLDADLPLTPLRVR